MATCTKADDTALPRPGSNSHIPDAISAPDFKGVLFTYSEVQFYLAEAAARGFNLPLPAETYYNEAIKTSFEFWGIPEVEDYLAKDEVKYEQSNWKEPVALQQWLGFYTRGFGRLYYVAQAGLSPHEYCRTHPRRKRYSHPFYLPHKRADPE
jgi:hypothetical protein